MTEIGTLFYDPDCGICQRAAKILAHAGLTARVVPSEVETLLDAGVHLERFMRQIPFRTEQGQVTYGALAIGLALRTSRYVPVRAAGVLLTQPLIRPVAERAYRLVADNRSSTCTLKP